MSTSRNIVPAPATEMLAAAIAVPLVAFSARVTAQPVIACDKLAAVGDRPAWAPGATITAVDTPCASSNGDIGFNGELTPDGGAARVFIFSGDRAIFTADQAPAPYVLSGRESAMGIAPGGRFMYSPRINGNDGLWSNLGYIISANDAAPGAPGKYIKFASGPSVFGDGNFAFIAGYSNAPGTTTTDRALYRGHLGTPGLTLVYRTGDVIAGQALRFTTPTLSFTYDSSKNASHLIHIVGTDQSGTYSEVLADGAFLTAPATAIGFSNYLEAWENFAGVGINDSGHWIIFGDSINYDEPSSDAYLAFNAQSIIHENDTVGGVQLLTPASCRAAAVNNLDQVAHLWQYTLGGGATAKALFAGDGSNLGASIRIVGTGDLLDTDNDGVADYTVQDLPENTFGSPGMDFAENGYIATRVAVVPIGGVSPIQAVIRFCVSGCATSNCPPCAADFDQDGGVTGSDVAAFFGAWESGEACGDVDEDGGITGADVERFFLVWEAGSC